MFQVCALTVGLWLQLGDQFGATIHAPAPLVLSAPITRSDDGLPLGNGLIGCAVWGEGNIIRLSLDRGDLWDLRTPDTILRPDWTYATMQRLVAAQDQAKLVELFDDPYNLSYPTKLPAGRLELEFPPATTVVQFSLDLATGEMTVLLDPPPSPPTSDGAPPPPAQPIVLRGICMARAPRLVLKVDGANPVMRWVPPAGLAKLEYTPPIITNTSSAELQILTSIQETSEGSTYAVAAQRSPWSGETLISVAITRADAGADPLPLAQAQASGDGHPYDQHLQRNIDWWKSFWAASSLTIPDADLQRHYDLCKYYYGAGSRRGSPPIPLQGLWTVDNGDLPPWKGDYHNDLNTQMTYAAYQTAGLFDQGLSFIDFNWSLLPRYRRFATEFYGVDGAVVPGVMTLDGSPTAGWGMYALSPTNSAWIAQSFYLHWKYTNDATFLRDRAYPWCAEIGRALLAILKPDDHGHLKLPLSSSPEIYDNSLRAWLPPNSNYDLSLLRWLFNALAEMADAAGQQGSPWRAALAQLDPLDTETDAGSSQHSLTFARGIPYRESHRHFSHAMAIHPLGLISIEGSPEDRAVVNATLDTIEQHGTKQWCGYSFSWFSAMCARAGRSDKALDYLQKYRRAFTGPNGFHLNGDQSGTGLSDLTYRPFTLEGNFLAMQAIHEMLLQSWGGTLRIFPATPDAWPDASFRDLRAEGGFRVSAERKNGKTTRITITCDGPANELRLRDPFPTRAVKWNRDDITKSGSDYQLRLDHGATLEGIAEP